MKNVKQMCPALNMISEGRCPLNIITFSFLTLLLSCGENSLPNSDAAGLEKPLHHREIVVDKISPHQSSFSNCEGVIVIADAGITKENHIVQIYDPKGVVWHLIDFFEVASYDSDKISPFSIKLEYGALDMRCIRKSKDWFEIIINENTNKITYVSVADPLLKFQTWTIYLKEMDGIDFDEQSNPILDAPFGRRIDVKLPEERHIEIVDVNEEWIQISWESIVDWHKRLDAQPQVVGTETDKPFVSNNHTHVLDNRKYGWIRWKQGQEFLIGDSLN